MTKKLSVVIALAMLLLVAAPVQAKPNAARTTTILGVEKNEYVIVRLENFPTNATYSVRMNVNGSYGINGYVSSKVTTNSDDTFLAKFPIPDELANEDIISIRFENIEGDNDPAYNYFYNDDAAFNPNLYNTATSDDEGFQYGEPQFTVLKVAKGSYITLETKYFPEGDRWAVFLKDGAMDAERLYDVNGFNATEGGIYKMTVTIPSDLQYKEKIAIIFYCLNDGYRVWDIAYNRDCEYPDYCTLQY